MPFPFSYFQDATSSLHAPPHDRLLRTRRLPPPRGTPVVPEGTHAQEPSPVLGDTRVEHRLTLYVHPHAICTPRGRAETGLRRLPSNLPAVEPPGGYKFQVSVPAHVGSMASEAKPGKRSGKANHVPVPRILKYSASIW